MAEILKNSPEDLQANGITTHDVVDQDNRLVGRILACGATEVVASLCPLIAQFGLSAEGLMDAGTIVLFCSPGAIPALVASASVEGYVIRGLEDRLQGKKDHPKRQIPVSAKT